MKRILMVSRIALGISILLLVWSGTLLAQSDAQAVPDSSAANDSAAVKKAPKILAPGVLKTIHPYIDFSETYKYSDVPEIVGVNPKYDWARDVFFEQDVWCLEFKFKTVRQIQVDLPNEHGFLEPQTIWYLVYSVTNTGKILHPELLKDEGYTYKNLKGIYKPGEVDYTEIQADADDLEAGSVNFVPRFVLATQSISPDKIYSKGEDGFYFSDAKLPLEAVYFDSFVPLAFGKIVLREDENQKFESTVSFPDGKIKPGETKWGIATWKNVDARIDKFSVYISGLTNAHRWKNNDEAYQRDAASGTGRTIERKVLKLNFYRPGDEFEENDKEIHFGAPGSLDFEWIYL